MKQPEAPDRVTGWLDTLETPDPPEGLRASALAAARAALAEDREPDVWARLWRHPGARHGWLAATLILGAAHLAIEAPRPGRAHGLHLADSSSLLDGELAETLAVPPIHLTPIAFLGESPSAVKPTPDQPELRKDTRS